MCHLKGGTSCQAAAQGRAATSNRGGHELGNTVGMLAEKLLSTSCIGFLVAVMSAINDEFRQKLVGLASGGLWEEASVFTASTMRWTNGIMDSFGAHGGDHSWLLVTAVVGAVVTAGWMMKW
jgi:hypothetical protein